MNVYEMEGFLRGKCLPGDMKVNESNAQYLVRKFSEFESNLSESKREFRAADATIHNLELKLTDLAVQLANAESKCRELAAENSEVKVASILLADEAAQIYKRWNLTQQPDGDIVDAQTIHELMCACHETRSTDAFLAEVRASAIDNLVDIKTKQLADMHPDTHAFGATAMSIRSQINELQSFASQLRKGAAL
ncbi:hypothetical protein [Citrobacter freundii]|uniref:hypothetical protein n=1 Tax=Citrobacter freundii TaxID=546 RepID=UPI00069CEA61|nr:hypothetical protein [Citrobacter freundii]